MSTYQGIRGLKVRDYTTNPDDPLEGQLWYNKTDQVGKYQIPNQTSSWRTGNSMNTARSQLAGAGTQTSSLVFGGEPGPPAKTADTESYDGTSWTEVNNLNTARRLLAGTGAIGTQALAVSGWLDPGQASQVESWNGSSWTETTDVNTARYSGGLAGTYTSSLFFGGTDPNYSAATESWNGSAWTELNDLNTARQNLVGTGADNTACLGSGGNASPGAQAVVESWNGSSWTETTDLNTGRDALAGSGTQPATIVFGGTPPQTGKTELWNGSSWSEQNDLSTSRNNLTGSSLSSILALASGGYSSDETGSTEEWNGATPVGAWSTTSALNTDRYNIGGIGTTPAALAVGGRGGSVPGNGTAITESMEWIFLD